jgi:general secretion pathway protein I
MCKVTLQRFYNINAKHVGGFTLLETLVALSVLAISIGVTYQVFSTALQGSTLADDYAQASMYADSHLADVGKRVHLLPAVSEGSYNQRYSWRLEVLPLDSTNSRSVVETVKRYQIVLNVYWRARKGQRSIRATTYRLASA